MFRLDVTGQLVRISDSCSYITRDLVGKVALVDGKNHDDQNNIKSDVLTTVKASRFYSDTDHRVPFEISSNIYLIHC
jgi:hypothetical protein